MRDYIKTNKYIKEFGEEYGFNEKPINRRITRVHAGDSIVVTSETGRKKYKIVKVYPFFVIGICKGEKRCFSVGDLVMLKIEPEKIDV